MPETVDPALQGKRILIVEDDSFLHRLLAGYLKTLRDQGVDVVPTLNVDEAMEAAKKKTPDLIMLDLVLPGKNGMDFLQALRADEQLKNVKVVVLSNLDAEEDKKKARDLGVVDYLVKANISLEDISGKIIELLKKPAPTA